VTAGGGRISDSNNRDLTKAKKAAGTGGTASQSSVTHKSIHKIPAMLSIPAATKLSGPDFVHISTPRKFWILAGIPRKQFLQLNPSQIYNQLGECNKIHNLRVNDVNNSEIYKHAQQEFAAADAQPDQ
jgi:hypothetical protein